jgi:hypothetical protein
MREHELRTLLLVKALEEADRDGTLLPIADRDTATRETLRETRDREVLGPDGKLTRVGARMLVARAERLLPGLVARHPALQSVATRASKRRWTWLLPLIAIGIGLALTTLDETRRINILAFPLVGLVLFNFCVYVALIVAAVWRAPGRKSGAWLATLVEALERRRQGRLRDRIGRVHEPLANALERYAREWWPIHLPILIAAAQRLMHFSAACVAVGLIVGMYLRGLVFRYDAGWESTFLGPEGVRSFLRAIYGPAATFSGIALPTTTDAINALEFRAGRPGVVAAPWIHLIAVTALLYVVVPRLMLAVLAGIVLVRRTRNVARPPTLAHYARAALGAVPGHATGLTIRLATYAYEMDQRSRNGLLRLARQALGSESRVDAETSVRYGEEDDYAQALRAEDSPLTGCLVGAMSLAATPEAESHGVVLTAWRDHARHAPGSGRLLFIVDEGPYRERLGQDASMQARLGERRELWQRFARSVGVPVLCTDLRSVSRTDGENAAAIAALHQCLWPAESAA